MPPSEPVKIPCPCGCGTNLSVKQILRHRRQAALLESSPTLPRNQVATNLHTKSIQRGRNKANSWFPGQPASPELVHQEEPSTSNVNQEDDNMVIDQQPDSNMGFDTGSTDEIMEESSRRPSVTIEEVDDEDGYGYCDYGDAEEGDFEIDDTIQDEDAYLWEQDHSGAYLWETGPPETLERELFSKGVFPEYSVGCSLT
jgi:hypothetical protein